ncbi:MAG: hypothetical protein WBO55_06645 [Rhizobiaceae bacterium]
MTQFMEPRRYESFEAALKSAYEEEIAGEAYFQRLADHHTGKAAQALQIMSRIETATVAAVLPVLKRHSVNPMDGVALRAAGIAEADERALASWHELLTDMVRRYPVYTTEFQQLVSMAPQAERKLLSLLTFHEEALLRFAELELQGSAESVSVLENCLKKIRQSNPGA